MDECAVAPQHARRLRRHDVVQLLDGGQGGIDAHEKPDAADRCAGEHEQTCEHANQYDAVAALRGHADARRDEYERLPRLVRVGRRRGAWDLAGGGVGHGGEENTYAEG